MEKRKKLRELSLKERVKYIWDYYRWHIFSVILIVFVLISFVHNRITYSEPILNIVLVNSTGNMTEEGQEFTEFLTLYGHEEKEVFCNYNVQTGEDYESTNQSEILLMTYIYAKEIDFFIWTDNSIEKYLDEGIMADISLMLTEKELEALKEDLIYATDLDTGKVYPCAIRLTDQAWAKEYGYYGDFYISISFNAPNFEIAEEFMEYLLSKKDCEQR